MKKLPIELTINGRAHELLVSPKETLLNVLRERFHLTGAKYGCGIGECGACTVLLDGLPVLSCQLLAVMCNGKKVVTIEGLSPQEAAAHPMQDSFVEEGAVQCGFCTPGMVISATALVEEKSEPTTEDIKVALRGNLCRCTGYENIIRAVKTGARKMKEV
ncbi:MAG: (2Fe-2S)-binding protein [Spirochaetia bacterium]|nr:(2Fe-2S)-binding protein [Spirochaetia bacterium]